MMKIPAAQEIHYIKQVLPIFQEMLDYCAGEAAVANKEGCLEYNWREDELIYHWEVTSLDRSLFDLLTGVEEIWIITRGMDES